MEYGDALKKVLCLTLSHFRIDVGLADETMTMHDHMRYAVPLMVCGKLSFILVNDDT